MIAPAFSGEKTNINKLESWYFYWGLGSAMVDYPPEIEADADFFGGARGAFYYDYRFTADMFGFYGPYTEKILIGLNINWIVHSDAIEGMNEEFSVRSPLVALSSIYFFGPRIGQGFFLRADAGLAHLSMESLIVKDSNVFPPLEQKKNYQGRGLGVLAGIGWGYPLSSETRLLISMNYSLRRISRKNNSEFNRTLTIKNLSILVGLLF